MKKGKNAKEGEASPSTCAQLTTTPSHTHMRECSTSGLEEKKKLFSLIYILIIKPTNSQSSLAA